MKRRIEILKGGNPPPPIKTSADYEFNKDLRLNYIKHEHRIATFSTHSGAAFCIIQRMDDYIVAAFHPDGRCSNAQSHSVHSSAWRHFDELRKEEKPFETPINYDYEHNLTDAPLVDDILADL